MKRLIGLVSVLVMFAYLPDLPAASVSSYPLFNGQGTLGVGQAGVNSLLNEIKDRDRSRFCGGVCENFKTEYIRMDKIGAKYVITLAGSYDVVGDAYNRRSFFIMWLQPNGQLDTAFFDPVGYRTFGVPVPDSGNILDDLSIPKIASITYLNENVIGIAMKASDGCELVTIVRRQNPASSVVNSILIEKLGPSRANYLMCDGLNSVLLSDVAGRQGNQHIRRLTTLLVPQWLSAGESHLPAGMEIIKTEQTITMEDENSWSPEVVSNPIISGDRRYDDGRYYPSGIWLHRWANSLYIFGKTLDDRGAAFPFLRAVGPTSLTNMQDFNKGNIYRFQNLNGKTASAYLPDEGYFIGHSTVSPPEADSRKSFIVSISPVTGQQDAGFAGDGVYEENNFRFEKAIFQHLPSHLYASDGKVLIIDNDFNIMRLHKFGENIFRDPTFGSNGVTVAAAADMVSSANPVNKFSDLIVDNGKFVAVVGAVYDDGSFKLAAYESGVADGNENGTDDAVDVCNARGETCNHVDDNCNGRVDDGLGVGEVCRVGTGACLGIGVNMCTAEGGVGCSVKPGRPVAEVCDGIDNDCDGRFDEECPCVVNNSSLCGESKGECRQGRMKCTSSKGWGNCVGAVGPAAEICNGKDDNCDGAVDEGSFGQCSVGTGACLQAGNKVCKNGAEVCEPVQGQGVSVPSPEACGDNIDNDCDGTVDNGCVCANGETRPCGPGRPAGVCRPGTQTCLNGAWGSCEGAVNPSDEVCGDSLDNDCDDDIDEGCPPIGGGVAGGGVNAGGVSSGGGPGGGGCSLIR